MVDDLKYGLLRNSVLAAELSDEECALLSSLITVTDLADGQVLVKEGDSDSHIHVVVDGVLAVARQSLPDGKWVNLHVLTKGDLAGELAFVDGNPHDAALRATGPVKVFSLERGKLESLLEHHPWIVYRVMRAIFRVVHGILNRMAVQTTELTNYIYKQHGKY